jgi:hypothetical protein
VLTVAGAECLFLQSSNGCPAQRIADEASGRQRTWGVAVKAIADVQGICMLKGKSGTSVAGTEILCHHCVKTRTPHAWHMQTAWLHVCGQQNSH